MTVAAFASVCRIRCQRSISQADAIFYGPFPQFQVATGARVTKGSGEQGNREAAVHEGTKSLLQGHIR